MLERLPALLPLLVQSSLCPNGTLPFLLSVPVIPSPFAPPSLPLSLPLQTGSAGYSSRGLVPRSIAYLFREAEGRRAAGGDAVSVRVSYLEIYNESLYDLLRDGAGGASADLTIRCPYVSARPSGVCVCVCVRVSLLDHQVSVCL